MQHDKLIDRLGGYSVLAKRLGRHPSTVCRWQTVGIPPELWPAVARMAKRAGIPGASVEALERNSPRYGQRTAKLKATAAPAV